MANQYKVLGQVNPSATTLTTLYAVPSGYSSVASTLTVCNQAASAATYRIAIRPAGATVENKHYIAYDGALPANDTVGLTLGMTLAQTDVVSVYASTSTVSFNLFGSEVS